MNKHTDLNLNSTHSRFSNGLSRILLSGLMAVGFFVAANTAFADGSGNADVVTGVGCMQDEAGFVLNCTASDIVLASSSNIFIIDDGCAFIGDTVTFSADFEVVLVAAARHDIGIWFATDGDPNGDAAVTGMCTAATSAYAPDPPWLDLDGTSDDPGGVIQDTCGDIDSSHNPLFPNITLTTLCVDNDGNGTLDLPNCTSWRQPGANDLCTSPDQAFPGAPSKCRCDEGFGVAIDVPGQITGVDKVTLDLNGDPLPGDPTVFEFSLTGPDADLPEDFTLADAQVPHVTPGLDAGSYNLSEAAQEGWELVSAVCTSDQGNPDQDLVASGGSLIVGSGEGLSCTFTNRVGSDSDVDGVDDSSDNCTDVANADQRDTDGDNIGNLCDPDVDGGTSCAVNLADLNVYRANFFLTGDLDTDNNGDGRTDLADLAILRNFFFQSPGPSASGCN